MFEICYSEVMVKGCVVLLDYICLYFQGEMCASPDIFAHLTHLLMNLAGGKLCAVLEVRTLRLNNINTNM